MTIPLSKKEIKRKADAAEARSRGDAIDGDSAAKKLLEIALSEGELAAEIKKLAALPVSVFETVRVAEAKRLNMRANMLELLVKAERAKTTKEQKDFLPHWKVEPWPDPVDGAALLDELRQYFNRYAVTPKHADVLLALWALHTWVFDSFNITPYLVITSPTRRCGKSLVLTILQYVCCRAKRMTACPGLRSTAALRLNGQHWCSTRPVGLSTRKTSVKASSAVASSVTVLSKSVMVRAPISPCGVIRLIAPKRSASLASSPRP